MGPDPQPWSTAAPRPVTANRYVQDAVSTPGRRFGRWLSAARPWIAVAAALAMLAGTQLLPPRPTASGEWAPSTPIHILAGDAHRPTATPAPATQPLGTPWRVAPAGPYEFIALQRASDLPVAYDPCRPLPYVVNERTAPPGAAALVAEAVDLVQDVTGLQFTYEGTTDEGPTRQRPAFQPTRYGDRWAPILIAWSDATEFAELEGDVAGVAGSTAVSAHARGPDVYVSGMVTLDGPQLTDILGYRHGPAQVRAVVIHELGHLLGLDHVDDPSQLMHGSAQATSLQQGDLVGLVALGSGACIPRL